jgi:ubiquitin-like protein Pup
MSQQHEKATSQPETQETADDTALRAAQEAGRAALQGIDDQEIDELLDEIDDVLEENATEVVSGFKQIGGQ